MVADCVGRYRHPEGARSAPADVARERRDSRAVVRGDAHCATRCLQAGSTGNVRIDGAVDPVQRRRPADADSGGERAADAWNMDSSCIFSFNSLPKKCSRNI